MRKEQFIETVHEIIGSKDHIAYTEKYVDIVFSEMLPSIHKAYPDFLSGYCTPVVADVIDKIKCDIRTTPFVSFPYPGGPVRIISQMEGNDMLFIPSGIQETRMHSNLSSSMNSNLVDYSFEHGMVKFSKKISDSKLTLYVIKPISDHEDEEELNIPPMISSMILEQISKKNG